MELLSRLVAKFIRSRPLNVIEKGKKRLLLKDSTNFVTRIYGLVKVGPDKLMVFNYNKGIFILDLAKQQFEPLNTPTNQILQQSYTYTVLPLRNGTIAVGTAYGGVLILNLQGELLHHLSERDGLANNQIHSLMEDHQGSLWAGTQEGITKIQLSLPFTTYNKNHKVKPRVHALEPYQDKLYVANDQGVFFLDNGQYNLVHGSESQHWQLMPYGKGLLTAGGNEGVFYLENDRVIAKLPAANSVMQIWVSRQDSSIIYVATYGGLRVYSFANQKFTDLGLLAATQTDCRSLLELPDGRLWVGSTNQGFFLVTFPLGKKTAQQVQAATVAHHTKGLNETKANQVFWLNQQAYFTSQTGLYEFDEKQQLFVKSQLLPLDFSQPRYQAPRLEEDREGNIWVLNGLTIARKLEGGGYQLDSLTLLPMGKAATDLGEDGKGAYWLATADALYHYDPRKVNPFPSFATHIARVALSNPDSLLPLDPSGGLKLAYQHNSLLFRFSALSFLNEKDNQYQYRLEPYEQAWSEWSQEAQKEYTNLHEGGYTFRVRSRSAYGQAGEETAYTFTVLPPWYRTWWAYLGYGLGLAGLIYWLVAMRTRGLRREKQNLEAIVQQRTQEINAQNQEIKHSNLELSKQRDEILLQKTALMNQKDEIMAQSEELASMNATKDKLFSIISHDLKSPLNRLSGMLKLLDMNGLTQDEFVHYAKQLRKDSDKLYDTLDNLLRWSMLQMQHGMVTAQEVIDIHPIITQVLSLYEENIREKGLMVHNLVPLGTQVYADPNQVKLILRNLTTNAIKFTRQGGSISITSEADGNRLNISVADAGVGMSQAQVAKLFDVKGNPSQLGTLGEKGTGIGLLLVREFVENNGGTIKAESQEGLGSTFTFSLPVSTQ
jgi:signal transduction histidine kinase